MTLADGEAIYQELESDTTTIDPFLRDQRLRFARLAFHACGGARREWECAVEETAFRYWAQEVGEKGARFLWGGSPSPVPSWTDMNTVPTDAADYLRHKASATSNPIHKARYLDVLWDRSGDYRSGIAAIQAYLDCCAIYRNNAWDKDLRDALRRAGQLARLLNQKAARDQVIKEVRLSVEFLESAGRPHWIGRVAGELPPDADPVDRQAVIEVVRRTCDHLRDLPHFHLYRTTLMNLGDLYKAAKELDKTESVLVEIGNAHVLEAKTKLTSNPIAAMHHYGEAIQHFVQIGHTGTLDDLKLDYRKATEAAVGAMDEIQIPLELDLNEVNQAVQAFLAMPLEKALAELPAWVVPKPDRVRERVKQSLGQSLLRLLFQPSRINQVGNISVAPQTDQEREEFYFMQAFGEDIELYRKTYIDSIMEGLRAHGTLTADTLIAHLQKSDLFQAGDSTLIEYGVRRYFEGDYIGSMHVLIPQIESLLRHCLGLLGLPTTAASRENPAVMTEKTLGSILEDPDLRTKLGEGLHAYLRCVYNEAAGWNLRNEVAHGLAGVATFSKANADTVIHTLLALANLTF